MAINNVTMWLLDIPERSRIVGRRLSQIIGDALNPCFEGFGKGSQTLHPFLDQRHGAQFFGILYKHKAASRHPGLNVQPTQLDPDACRGD